MFVCQELIFNSQSIIMCFRCGIPQIHYSWAIQSIEFQWWILTSSTFTSKRDRWLIRETCDDRLFTVCYINNKWLNNNQYWMWTRVSRWILSLYYVLKKKKKNRTLSNAEKKNIEVSLMSVAYEVQVTHGSGLEIWTNTTNDCGRWETEVICRSSVTDFKVQLTYIFLEWGSTCTRIHNVQ